ncbi:hypothetical protein BCR39DRAFT_349959 [Naematelia encephala]|uniref:TPR-like protein n=1 Tax=Naematelia encephala TaxID=71784 RepID=A0A1Y2BE09_9TREE|nr:hypothetical protein BCR39DRAFT_349959 [Naematelia encephala]
MVDLFNKTKAKSSTTTHSSGPSSTSTIPAAAAAATSASGPSEADKQAAEALKAKGNALMGQKLYDSAIEQYTEAIKLDANPVYYSNRAAAWGGLGEHEKAAEDAERALEIDPKFSKAYSRLG